MIMAKEYVEAAANMIPKALAATHLYRWVSSVSISNLHSYFVLYQF